MTERVARVVAGQGISATRANTVGDQLSQIDDVLIPLFGADPEPDNHASLMTITDVAGTELLAIAGTLAPVGGESVFTVRLPPELAEGSRDGVTITITDVNNATATDGVALETWRMNKSYAVGDVIEAFQWDADGVYVDRNIAGRMWAAEALVSGGGG